MSALPLSCVVDASVGIKLFLPEEHSDKAQEVFANCLAQPQAELFVPDLLFVECANILWKKIRRAEYDSLRATADLADLRAMRLSTTPTFELVERALEIACAHDITAYDACYVALAEGKGVPLVTADDRLATKLAGSPYEMMALCQLT